MKIKIKISEKDQKLLCLIVSLILVAFSYFFIYAKNISKAQQINADNVTLQTKADELAAMEANADAKKAEIKEFKMQMEKIESKFPVALNVADAIVMLDQFSKYAGVNISTSSFAMNQVFYSSESSATNIADTSTPKTSTANTDSTNTAGNPPSTGASVNVGQTQQFLGQKSNITLTYQTSYIGLKKAIDFINQYEGRMTIESLSTAYDTSTGNLMGSMTLNMYSLSGTEIKKEYVEPYIGDVNVGRDNIFGTGK